MERIEIEVEAQRLAENDAKNERLRKTRAFEATDRTPVLIEINQWAALAARNQTAGEYLRSPADNLREQILNHKWRIENIHDDLPIPESLSFQPDLGCLRGVEFEMEITWLDDGPPKCSHPLSEPEQIDTLSIPQPTDGLNAKRVAWYHEMVAASHDLEVTLNGQPLPVNITLSHPGGPMPTAFALAGENLFLWMALEPERIHRLMKIITESHLNCVRFFDEMLGRSPVHPIGLGGDTGEMLSPEMFREFVVPYYTRIWEAYPGERAFHNCGKNEHLLEIIRDELKINLHNGFGFCVDPDQLAEKMSGRIVMRGGPHPSLVQSGSREEIIASAKNYIKILSRRSGYILDLGGGTAPGTSVENYLALVEASKEMGGGIKTS